MAFDAAAILLLSGEVRDVLCLAQTTGASLSLRELPPFRLVFMGPEGGGKAALIQALLGPVTEGVPALVRRGRMRTSHAPVEYRFGRKARLLLAYSGTANASEQWREVALDDARAASRHEVSNIRVELPAPILAKWDATFIDWPSIDGAHDLRYDHHAAPGKRPEAVLYVVPGRGISDVDTQALESLRNHAVAVVEALHDEELIPTRSLLERVELPGLACPFVVPIVAVRVADTGPDKGRLERQALLECIALLRAQTLPPTRLTRFRDEVRSARAGLAETLSLPLADLHAACRSGDALVRLNAVKKALDLERKATVLAPLEQALPQLFTEIERSATVTVASRILLLRRTVSALIDRYNVEAGQRGARRPSSRQSSTDDFGAAYVEAREELLGFIQNILKNDTLDLTGAERESLQAVVEAIQHDRVEIALLGRFSSGKSSLINALLGVPVDDRSSQLLPTSVRPETATVNRIEYSQKTELREVSWLERTALTFLSETGDPGQLRVHLDEVRAFHHWIATGQVIAGQCQYTLIASDPEGIHSAQRRGASANQRLFESLCQALDFPARIPRFVYLHSDFRTPKLPRGLYPASVEIARFERSPEHWPKAPTLQQAFEHVKAHPSVALRVRMLRVGYDHPLLQHASIIDTPGTDAPIPHHRKVAREIVRDKGCPVLYCFLGTRAGGHEDRENLRILRDWGVGKTDLTRFFFVITMRGQINPSDQKEVYLAVKRNLSEIGITPARLYFTEVVQERNEDFEALKNDVGRFVAESRRPLYGSWVSGARKIIEGVCLRYETRLQSLVEGEKVRLARRRRLEREAQILEKISDDFETSKSWGPSWATARLRRVLADESRGIGEEIEALKSPEDFEQATERLEAALECINKVVKNQVMALSDGITQKLISMIASHLQERRIAAASIAMEDDLFPSASILEAARIEGRSFLRKMWDFVRGMWSDDIMKDSRERILREWGVVRENGLAAAFSQLESTVSHLRREILRISGGIRHELDLCARRESPKDADKLAARRDQAAAWLHRFDAIARKFNGESRA